MNTRILFVTCCFLAVSASAFAQSKIPTTPSIIDRTATIKKYHDKRELSEMQKGQLLELCIERIDALAKILPYIPMATKPGVSMTDIGIPNTPDYKKKFDEQQQNTANYTASTADFQRVILPYSDSGDLMNAVLFYENIMKSLNGFDDL